MIGGGKLLGDAHQKVSLENCGVLKKPRERVKSLKAPKPTIVPETPGGGNLLFIQKKNGVRSEGGT